LPAIEVTDGVLQDALKKHRQFRGWFCCVLFRELEHGILDDIERIIRIAQREQRLLVGTPFDTCKKLGKLASRGQSSVLCRPKGPPLKWTDGIKKNDSNAGGNREKA